MEETLYWVWLSLLFPNESKQQEMLLSQVNSPKEFYALSADDITEQYGFTPRDANLIKHTSLSRAELIVNACTEKNISIVAYGDELYPKRLRMIYSPPAVLYYTGNISGIDDSVVITVVGTRDATDYSASVTEYLSAHMAAAGAIIISGCAVGIDAAAHRGALAARGRTIAVLGCGIDVDYPHENHDLKKEILDAGGALISELPPGTPTASYVFRSRNRILAGLSLGTLVTHAPERSGALITAEHALEQGKEVFCVPPYSIFDARFYGVIRYLRDGATPVFCADDVLQPYAYQFATALKPEKMQGDYVIQKKHVGKMETVKKKTVAPKQKPPEKTPEQIEEETKQIHQRDETILSSLSDASRKVYQYLTITPCLVDDLAVSAEMPVSGMLAALTELEIAGLAESMSGRRYTLKRLC